MTPEQFRRVGEVFRDVRLRFGTERASRLEQVGPRGDPVRDEVEALLAESELPTPMLDRRLVPEGAAISLAEDAATGHSPGLFAGAMIGEFRVIGLIGAGSMGEVYEAEQDDPKRRVALKVVSSPLGSGELGRRLKQESAILGRLRHPGIAQVYRAGVAQVGERSIRVPYLAMELVGGAEPITLYANEHGLSLGQRVELFAGVCDAVQHGHQRGVIHRDLKPANILVDRASGETKVIDFGVARLIEPDGALTLGTAQGQLIGTLAYMSPEQCAGEADIDTRADVYALGAVLLELLCGKPPVDVTGRGLAEVVRVITHDPARTLASVRPDLAGDLDTIVGKALAKDRSDRYASAAQLADDLRRYLGDQPIAARPPTVMHQLRLLARRNRVLVGAAGTVAAVLTITTGISSALAVYATGQAKEAENARAAADAERARAVKVAQFLQGALGSANPYLPMRLPEEVVNSEFDHWADWRPTPWPYCGKPGQAATPADILNTAASRLEEVFSDDPESLASVGTVLGRTLYNLDGPDHGLGALKQAAEASQRAHGDDHETTIRATLMLAEAMGRWERADKPRVRALYQRAVDACTRLYGPGDPRTLDAVRLSAYDVASWDLAYGDAATMLLDAVQNAEHAGRGTSVTTLRLQSYAAFMLGLNGDFQRSEALVRRTIEQINAGPGASTPVAAEAWDQLGQILRWKGDHSPEAIGVQQRAADICGEVYGKQSYQTLGLRGRVASQHIDAGNWKEAADILRSIAEDYRRLLGEERFEVVGARQLAAAMLCNLDAEPEERLRLASFVRRVQAQSPPGTNPNAQRDSWTTRILEAEAHMALGHDGAEVQIRQLVDEATNYRSEDQGLRMAIGRYRLANRLIGLHRLAEARTLLTESEQLLTATGSNGRLATKVLVETREKLEHASEK